MHDPNIYKNKMSEWASVIFLFKFFSSKKKLLWNTLVFEKNLKAVKKILTFKKLGYLEQYCDLRETFIFGTLDH